MNGKLSLILACILIMAATLACAFAETLTGQVLPTVETAHQDTEIPSEEGSSTQVVEPTREVDVPEASSVELSSDELYLFAPIRSTDTYLMNDQGVAVYTWESDYNPGNSVYLLENGHLLRTGTVEPGSFGSGGAGGIVQEIAPDSTVVWEFQYANDQVQQHHDIELLPSGNILMIAWELKTQAEAVTAGRDLNLLSDGELWPDHVIEVDPTNNEIVWEWHVWDHLVQDIDPAKENYGVVAEHPELIDLNFNDSGHPDWNHINSIDYNTELDQILLSVHNFSEIWIIDHSTTTEEAAGQRGDLLYRWGNPAAYDSGTAADQQFFVQHDAQWIGAGLLGEGNILVFNNGDKRSRPYSSVDEIVPPLNTDGSYALAVGAAYGPEAPIWTYVAENPSDFFADHISGAQRLSNGDTLICSGTDGAFFEVTPAGEVVWRYNYGGSIFRVTKIAPDYPGLASLNLQPTNKLKAETNNNHGQRGQPPQRAIDACAGLSLGNACTINGPNQSVNGSCRNMQSQLVCIPEGDTQGDRP